MSGTGVSAICLSFVSTLSIALLSKYEAFGLNNRPVIGVLSQTSGGDFKKYGDTYILSSYVKYLESGGARVVPIRIDESFEYYQDLFSNINGVLFPGGGANLSTSGYAKAGKILWDLAIEANKAGDFFPVWGTCLGFQFLTVLVTNRNLLGHFDAENLPLPLDLKYPDYQMSKLFGFAPPDIIESLKTQNVTANNHEFGISPQTFSRNEDLNSFFRVLSTNKDRKGKVFVSTIEGRHYPVWGAQYHPEKNAFIWDEYFKWLHTEEAIKVTQYMSDFFVDQARRNSHTFPSETVAAAAVIENYRPVYLKTTYPYESIYIFNFTSNSKVQTNFA